MSWFKKLMSSDAEASSKRFVCIVLVIVHVVALFLLMYFKIMIANKDLVLKVLDANFWLILIFGGFIAAEPLLKKWKIGGPSVVAENVEEQNIKIDNKKNEPLAET